LSTNSGTLVQRLTIKRRQIAKELQLGQGLACAFFECLDIGVYHDLGS
jgi:hypothetical protein